MFQLLIAKKFVKLKTILKLFCDDNFTDFYWFEWMLCRMHVHTGCVNKKGGEQNSRNRQRRTGSLVFFAEVPRFWCDLILCNFGICFHLFSLVMTFSLTLVYTDNFSQNFLIIIQPILGWVLVSRAILWFFSLYFMWREFEIKIHFWRARRQKSSEKSSKIGRYRNKKSFHDMTKNAKNNRKRNCNNSFGN